MKRMIVVLAAAAAVFFMAVSAHALWSVSDTGRWPDTWPKELEPLRKQSKSYTGSLINRTFHQIRFANREDFESAWPHLLKVKSKGAPIILARAPIDYLGPFDKGLRIWVALPSSKPMPEEPLAGVQNTRERWLYTTHIELVVDGKIVDLNRIAFPPDTPIIDERFPEAKKNAK